MTKRNRIILAVVIVTALAIGLILKLHTPNPTYDGQPLSYWITVYPVKPSGGFRAFDSNAVPYLIHTLKTRDGPLKEKYINLYWRLPSWLRTRLKPPASSAMERYASCRILGLLGPAARPAIPELIRTVNTNEESSVQVAAIGALSSIAGRDDASVMECLTAAAKDGDPSIRWSAESALQDFDDRATAKARPDVPKMPESTPQ